MYLMPTSSQKQNRYLSPPIRLSLFFYYRAKLSCGAPTLPLTAVRADVHFSSPSQAAAFATGHSYNGWAQWKTRWAINRRLPPASKLFFAALAVIVRHGMAISLRASCA